MKLPKQPSVDFLKEKAAAEILSQMLKSLPVGDSVLGKIHMDDCAKENPIQTEISCLRLHRWKQFQPLSTPGSSVLHCTTIRKLNLKDPEWESKDSNVAPGEFDLNM